MPEGPAANKMTPKRWEEFIHATANGTRKDSVLKNLDITNQTFQAYLISKPDAANQYREANLSWVRKKWPIELIEDMLEEIAMGSTAKASCQKHHVPEHQFHKLVLRDPVVREMYDEACKIKVERMADECLEIIDDLQLDEETSTPGFNNALITQAKAKITTRQWIMSKLNFTKFGDRSRQEVETKLTVDHVDALDRARKRKETANKKKKEILQQMKKEEAEQQDPLTVH